MKRGLLYLLLICTCTSCRIQQTNENSIPATNYSLIRDKKDIDEYILHKNDTLELMFITNSSTGHHWRWLNQKSCSLVDSIDIMYHQDHPELIGSSAKMYWRFCARNKGIDTLHFGYGPVYNSDIIVKERKVTIKVAE